MTISGIKILDEYRPYISGSPRPWFVCKVSFGDENKEIPNRKGLYAAAENTGKMCIEWLEDNCVGSWRIMKMNTWKAELAFETSDDYCIFKLAIV